MMFDELDDTSLARLHRSVRASIRRGDFLAEEIRNLGVRDLLTLRERIQEMESLLEARGVDFHSVAAR
jgi:hypothetical protein